MKKDEKKNRILKKAEEMFLSYGYSKVSMDDLATKLGMSKKTLYAYFRSKEELMNEVVVSYSNDILKINDKIFNDGSLNYEEKVIKIFANAATRLSAISPFFIEDLNRTAPGVWNNIVNLKSEATKARYNDIIKMGVSSGLVKKDINIALAVLLFSAAIESFFNPMFLKQIPVDLHKMIPNSASDVYEELVKIILHGIIK